MRQISEATSRVTHQTIGRKYVALGRIAMHWSEIIGQDLASKASPAKIHYRKYKNKSSAGTQATLEIATSTAHATRLHYQKDLILERINQIFGERLITDIKFVNIPVNDKKRKYRKPSKRLLEPGEEKELSNMLDLIDDPDIKERLKDLGEALIKENDIQR